MLCHSEFVSEAIDLDIDKMRIQVQHDVEM